MDLGRARRIIRNIYDEETEREDQEQIEYLRKWKEKREKKREHRRKVKLYDRLFAGRKR